MFCFIVILLINSSKMINYNERWFNYKVITLLYLTLTMMIYMYCLAENHQIIKLPFVIKKDFLNFTLNFGPYLISLMRSFMFLSFYDLMKQSHFSIQNTNKL